MLIYRCIRGWACEAAAAAARRLTNSNWLSWAPEKSSRHFLVFSSVSRTCNTDPFEVPKGTIPRPGGGTVLVAHNAQISPLFERY
jgi:hypothetical protein